MGGLVWRNATRCLNVTVASWTRQRKPKRADVSLGKAKKRSWHDVTCIVRRARTIEETVVRDSLREESFASSRRTLAATPTSYEDKIMFLAIQQTILSPSSLRQDVAADVTTIVTTTLVTQAQGKHFCKHWLFVIRYEFKLLLQQCILRNAAKYFVRQMRWSITVMQVPLLHFQVRTPTATILSLYTSAIESADNACFDR